MRAKEIYEKETGNKAPDNQIAYHEWFIDYVVWLEKKVGSINNTEFKNSPKHDKKAIVELMDKLNPESMSMIVELIQNRIKIQNGVCSNNIETTIQEDIYYIGNIKYLVDIEYHGINETITCNAIHLVKASNVENARKALVNFFEKEYVGESNPDNVVLVETNISQTIVGE